MFARFFPAMWQNQGAAGKGKTLGQAVLREEAEGLLEAAGLEETPEEEAPEEAAPDEEAPDEPEPLMLPVLPETLSDMLPEGPAMPPFALPGVPGMPLPLISSEEAPSSRPGPLEEEAAGIEEPVLPEPGIIEEEPATIEEEPEEGVSSRPRQPERARQRPNTRQRARLKEIRCFILKNAPFLQAVKARRILAPAAAGTCAGLLKGPA